MEQKYSEGKNKEIAKFAYAEICDTRKTKNIR